jgi:hypothetical protein
MKTTAEIGVPRSIQGPYTKSPSHWTPKPCRLVAPPCVCCLLTIRPGDFSVIDVTRCVQHPSVVGPLTGLLLLLRSSLPVVFNALGVALAA